MFNHNRCTCSPLLFITNRRRSMFNNRCTTARHRSITVRHADMVHHAAITALPMVIIVATAGNTLIRPRFISGAFFVTNNWTKSE